MMTLTAVTTQAPPGPRGWRPRRVTETVVLLFAVALVAGTVAGIVLSQGPTTEPPPGAGDGLAWLRDQPAGHAVQVNPANGRPENRLTVAAPGTGFEVAQRDGLLVVTTADGRLTIIDIATLTLTGGYQGSARTLALLDDEHLYAVDLNAGAISELDPADGHTITAWTAGLPLVHATLDGHGTLWAIRTDRQLFELAATDGQLTEVSAPVTIGAAGSDITLVGLRDGGVTALAPGDPATEDSGTAVRVGTTTDGTTTVAGLTGPILAPDYAPADGVISVSKLDTSTVLLIGRGGTIAVDTSPYGCDHPTESLEKDGLTYVSCHGAGLVIALDARGRHTPPDLRFAPGTNPDITYYGGQFFAIGGTTVYVNGQPTDLTGFPVAAAPPKPKPKPNNPPGNNQPGGGVPTGPVVPPATSGPGRPPEPPASVQVAGATGNGTTLTLEVQVAAAQANGAPVTGYTITATGAQPTDLTDPGNTSITVDCGGPCWNFHVDIAATAHSGAGDSTATTASFTHPDGFPGGPQNGDPVLTFQTGYIDLCQADPQLCTACAANPPACCAAYPALCSGGQQVPATAFTYQPLATWSAFTGTCQVVFGGGSPVPVVCGNPAYWGPFPSAGLTGAWAQACIGSVCVTTTARPA